MFLLMNLTAKCETLSSVGYCGHFTVTFNNAYQIVSLFEVTPIRVWIHVLYVLPPQVCHLEIIWTFSSEITRKTFAEDLSTLNLI